MQTFILALLFYLLALFPSSSWCANIKTFNATSGGSSKKLGARTGFQNEATHNTEDVGIPGLVLELWRHADKKVPVNNKFVKTTLNPTKNIVLTTGACYGCTAVALCSKTTCVMAHFQENVGKINPWISEEASDMSFEENIEGPIEDIMLENKDNLGPHPFAVIFTPSTANGKLMYRRRISGKNGITDTIEREIPQASVEIIGYNYAKAKADFGDDEVWGKLILEWKGGETKSAETAGISVLNIFAEESWHRSFHFNAYT